MFIIKIHSNFGDIAAKYIIRKRINLHLQDNGNS